MEKPKDYLEDVFLALAAVRDGEADRKKTRVLLDIPGAGMKGVNSAAISRVLSEADLVPAFNVITGRSSGCAVAAYTAAGKQQTKLGCELFLKEIPKCVHPERGFGRIIDSDTILALLREGKYSLDLEAVHDSPVEEVRAGITWRRGGGYAELSLKYIGKALQHSLVLNKMMGSMNIPFVSQGKRWANGYQVIDGAVYQDPLLWQAERYRPTHILIAMSASPNDFPQRGLLPFISDAYISARYSWHLKAIRNAHFCNLANSIRKCKEMGISVGIIWSPPTKGGVLTKDISLLEDGFQQTLESTEKTLAGLIS